MRVLSSFIIFSFLCVIKVTAEFILASLAAGAGAYLYLNFQSIQNSRLLNGALGGEACTDKFIQQNWESLEKNLLEKVEGQSLALTHIIAAFKNHFRYGSRSSKALAMSFHGPPGTGKNLIADIIMKTLFKKSSSSRFVHKFNSRIDFPLKEMVPVYQVQLRNWIIGNVTACEKAIFVFDEVDKFPEGLLNVLNPFIDHHAYVNGVHFGQATFLFLSNAAGEEIMMKMIDLRDSGRANRDTLYLGDFEQLIKTHTYNEEGGFLKSDIIGHHLVDFYIPFLPLEEEHVRKCIKNEHYEYLRDNNIHSRNFDFNELENYVLSSIPFEKSSGFAVYGCKHVRNRVGIYHEMH